MDNDIHGGCRAVLLHANCKQPYATEHTQNSRSHTRMYLNPCVHYMTTVYIIIDLAWTPCYKTWLASYKTAGLIRNLSRYLCLILAEGMPYQCMYVPALQHTTRPYKECDSDFTLKRCCIHIIGRLYVDNSTSPEHVTHPQSYELLSNCVYIIMS